MPQAKRKIRVSVSDLSGHEDIDPAPLRKLAAEVCGQFGPARADISAVLVDDKHIRRLHKRFLGSAKNTDVISFDLSEPKVNFASFEIIINADMAARQALKKNHGKQAEIALYLVHGLLHQMGFDDSEPAQARKMHRTEDMILTKAGCGPVFYGKRKKQNTEDRINPVNPVKNKKQKNAFAAELIGKES